MMNSYEYSESEAPNLLFSYSSQSNYPSCPIPISTPIPPFNCGLNSSPEFPPVFGNEYMNENNNNNNIISDNACVVIDKSINNNEIDNTNTSNSNYNNNENHDNNYLYAKSHSFPLPLPLPLPSPYGIYNSSLPDHSTPVAESLLSGYVDDYPINNGIPSNINNNNNNNMTCINTNINTSQMPNINNANDDNDDAVGDENNGHITLTLPSLENNINKNKNNNKGTNAADDAYSQCDISTNNNNNKLISNNNNYAHSQLQSPPLLSSILPQTPIDCPVTRVRMSQEEIDYYLSQQMHTETPPTPDLLHNNTNTNTHRSPKHKSRVHPLQKSSFFVQDIDSDLSENNYTYDNNMNDPIHLYQCNSPNYYNNYNYNPWTHFSHTPQSPQMPTLTPQTPPIPQIPSLNTSIKTEIKMELDSHDNSNSNSNNAPIPIKSDIITDNDNDNDSDSDYDIMADRAKLKSIIKKSKSITATKSRKKRRGRKRKLSSCTKKPKKQLKKEKIKKRTRTNDSSSPTPRPHKKQKISHRHTTPTCDVEQYVAETMSKKEANAIFKQYIQNGECIISNGDKDGYWCKVNKCNKRFGSKCHLKRHCDEQHIGRGYKCIYNKCNSIFKQRVQGKEHVKNIHFGDNRQWICYLCGDDFTRWWGVRRHLELNRCDIINNKKYKSTYSTVQIAKIIKDAQDGKSRNKCRVNKFHKC